MKAVVDNTSKYPDWSKRDDIKAKLKVELILLLHNISSRRWRTMMCIWAFWHRRRILNKTCPGKAPDCGLPHGVFR
jgi:hypothetical protein